MCSDIDGGAFSQLSDCPQTLQPTEISRWCGVSASARRAVWRVLAAPCLGGRCSCWDYTFRTVAGKAAGGFNIRTERTGSGGHSVRAAEDRRSRDGSRCRGWSGATARPSANGRGSEGSARVSTRGTRIGIRSAPHRAGARGCLGSRATSRGRFPPPREPRHPEPGG